MPSRDDVLAEFYRWRVLYDDGTVLREEDDCPDQPGAHTFHCIDRARAVRIYLDPAAVTLDLPGPEWEPIFFRRRRSVLRPSLYASRGVVEAYREALRRQERLPTETWVGRRRVVDGVTVEQEYRRVLADGTVEDRSAP